MLLAVERGDVGGERVGAVLPLGGLEVEEADVVVERGDAERAKPAREPGVDHFLLRLGQPDAGKTVDAIADQPELLEAERKLAEGGSHRLAGLGGWRHAAFLARTCEACMRTTLFTSRIRATRPSPRMVPPAPPGTACRFDSGDFTTSCCWPMRLSTRSAAARPSTSTTRQSGSGRCAPEAGSWTTASRQTIRSGAPRPPTQQA